MNAGNFPSAPANLLGSAVGQRLALSWVNTWNGAAPTGVRIDVSGSITTAIDLPVTEQFAFDGVPPGTYTFTVTPLVAGVPGDSSNAVTLTFPGTCPAPPNPPLAFSLSTQAGRVYLDWLPPSSGPAVTHYVVHATGAFTGSFPLTARTFSARVAPGSYTVSIAAVGPCGTSAPDRGSDRRRALTAETPFGTPSQHSSRPRQSRAAARAMLAFCIARRAIEETRMSVRRPALPLVALFTLVAATASAQPRGADGRPRQGRHRGRGQDRRPGQRHPRIGVGVAARPRASASVAEVFTHVAADNYFFPAAFGTATPAGVGISGTDYKTVGRLGGQDPHPRRGHRRGAEVIRVHEDAMAKTPAATIEAPMKIFGRRPRPRPPGSARRRTCTSTSAS